MSAGTSTRSRTLPLDLDDAGHRVVDEVCRVGHREGHIGDAALVPEPGPQLLGDMRGDRGEHDDERLDDLARHGGSLVKALLSSMSLATAVLKRSDS